MTDQKVSGDLVAEFRGAFAKGLREHFGDAAGPLFAEVLDYHPNLKIDDKKLKQTVEMDSGMVLEQVVGGRVDGSTLQGIRAALIGSALIHDLDAVVRWAKEGEVRCADAGPHWATTTAQWQWAAAHPLEFVNCALALKRFVGLR